MVPLGRKMLTRALPDFWATFFCMFLAKKGVANMEADDNQAGYGVAV